MNRGELESFIAENFGVDADYPWVRYPTHAVFRHGDNRKWFALIMDVPRNRLGLQGAEPLAVLNVKCDPFLIGSLRGGAWLLPRISHEQGHLDHRCAGRQCGRWHDRDAA